MTVRELTDALAKENPDALVVMASDAEGNGHSPLYSLWDGAYAADSTWSGRVGFVELTPELEADGYGPGDVVKGVPAVILTPVN